MTDFKDDENIRAIVDVLLSYTKESEIKWAHRDSMCYSGITEIEYWGVYKGVMLKLIIKCIRMVGGDYCYVSSDFRIGDVEVTQIPGGLIDAIHENYTRHVKETFFGKSDILHEKVSPIIKYLIIGRHCKNKDENDVNF